MAVRQSYANWLARIGEFDKSLELIDELEKLCSVSVEFYELSRSAALCAGELQNQIGSSSPATFQKHKTRYLQKTIKLLQQSVSHSPTKTTKELVETEMAFDAVRHEETFRSLVDTLVGEHQ